MKTIADYIHGLGDEQSVIADCLHHRLTQKHDLKGEIKWNIPTYHRKSMICYLNAITDLGIELVFYRGVSLSNEQGLLDSKGRKLVAGVTLYDLKNIPLQAIDELVNEALILDEMKRKK